MSEETTNMETNEEVNSNASAEEVAEAKVEDINEAKKEDPFKEKFYYVAAELENTRRRFEREKENLLKYGNEKVLSALLPVIDNFDLTVNSLKSDTDEKIQNIVKGIQMIRTQFINTLKQNGLSEVESVGKQFDPNFHEAVAQTPAPGVEHNEIVTEYQRGFVLNGRLLRASKVVVANNN